jgi:alanyl-tRNA synthetase
MHVHQAGSYVGPDKLRFDFTHASSVSRDELREIEQQVNDWILESLPVRAITTTLDEAKALGATALFGEKYGDIVRMVEVGDGSFSRELCGGTHVRTTSEIGVFKILAETSSAANVRRIEAVTGPAGVELLRRHDRTLTDASQTLRVPPERVPDSVSELRSRVRALEREAKQGGGQAGIDVDELASGAVELDGFRMLVAAVRAPDGKALLDVADRLKNKLGDAVIVLGSTGDDRVDLIASVAPSLVSKGLRAGELVKIAAAEVGGGGGGRDTLARAGGRDVEKLPEALEAARAAIESAVAG